MAPSPTRPAYRNKLLLALSKKDLAALAPHLEPMEFGRYSVFEQPGEPIRHLYFIESGVASVVADNVSTRPGEVGVIGREGLTGIPVLLGADRSPHKTYGQIPGAAQRIGAPRMQALIAARPSLHFFLLKFAHVFMVQAAQTALSYARTGVEARLARWLLMAHDRVQNDSISLTHEFLSIMLGVRRAGVTDALHALEGRGLISAGRSPIVLHNRAGLQRVAGRTYGIAEAEYRRLFPEPRTIEPVLPPEPAGAALPPAA